MYKASIISIMFPFNVVKTLLAVASSADWIYWKDKFNFLAVFYLFCLMLHPFFVYQDITSGADLRLYSEIAYIIFCVSINLVARIIKFQ